MKTENNIVMFELLQRMEARQQQLIAQQRRKIGKEQRQKIRKAARAAILLPGSVSHV